MAAWLCLGRERVPSASRAREVRHFVFLIDPLCSAVRGRVIDFHRVKNRFSVPTEDVELAIYRGGGVIIPSIAHSCLLASCVHALACGSYTYTELTALRCISTSYIDLATHSRDGVTTQALRDAPRGAGALLRRHVCEVALPGGAMRQPGAGVACL